MIKCEKCWIEKDENYFWTTVIKWVKYFRHTCKECISKWQKEYRKVNSDKLKEDNKKYYENNREYFREKSSYHYHYWWWKEKRIDKENNDKLFYKFYYVYYWIKYRCDNKNCKEYKYYWWRWIKNEWKSFSEFYNDMFESYIKHWIEYWFSKWYCQIDRINNDGNYCKDNCRWVTSKQNNSWNHQKEIDLCKIILILKQISNETLCPSTS